MDKKAPVEPLRAKPRVWWKTGDEGEFMMTPHFDGMEATYRAEGWLPTYDDPADLLSAALHQPVEPLRRAQDAIRAVLHDVRTSTEGLKYETLEACCAALHQSETPPSAGIGEPAK